MYSCRPLFVLLFLVSKSSGFSNTRRFSYTSNSHKLNAQIAPLIAEPAAQYASIWVPLFKEVQQSVSPELAPTVDFLLHWGHGLAMLTVLIFMGGIGTYLGFQIRNGNGDGKYWFTLGKTAREQHPLIMGLAAFFFLLGGNGGLVLTAVQGKSVFQSDHADTAVIGLSLLAIQVLLPVFFKSQSKWNLQATRKKSYFKNKPLRDVHATLGVATMATLCVHAFYGIQLGLSF